MDKYIDPSRENFALFKSLPRDTPIHMLNLIRFKEKAAYPEGHELAEKGMSGAEAYAEYMRTIRPVLARANGKIVWKGGFEAVVTQHWKRDGGHAEQRTRHREGGIAGRTKANGCRTRSRKRCSWLQLRSYSPNPENSCIRQRQVVASGDAQAGRIRLVPSRR